MFKDTPDGQTYHDPEAERKAREPMQDLIKESASEFRAQVDNYDSIFWTKNGNEEDNDCLSEEAILDWHTKQMEKAYEKGRSDEIKELKGTVIDDIIKKLSS